MLISYDYSYGLSKSGKECANAGHWSAWRARRAIGQQCATVRSRGPLPTPNSSKLSSRCSWPVDDPLDGRWLQSRRRIVLLRAVRQHRQHGLFREQVDVVSRFGNPVCDDDVAVFLERDPHEKIDVRHDLGRRHRPLRQFGDEIGAAALGLDHVVAYEVDLVAAVSGQRVMETAGVLDNREQRLGMVRIDLAAFGDVERLVELDGVWNVDPVERKLGRITQEIDRLLT